MTWIHDLHYKWIMNVLSLNTLYQKIAYNYWFSSKQKKVKACMEIEQIFKINKYLPMKYSISSAGLFKTFPQNIRILIILIKLLLLLTVSLLLMFQINEI